MAGMDRDLVTGRHLRHASCCRGKPDSYARADPDPLGDLRASDREIADSMPTRDLSRAAFHGLIDRIEDAPLPAARFIDRFGVIHTPSE